MKSVAFLAVIIASFLQTNGLILDCTFKVSNYSILSDIYSCNANVIFLSENDVAVQYVFQNHIKGKKNADVTALNVSNHEFQSNKIPGSIDTFFPNLRILELKNAAIAQLSQSDISPFTKLEILILWNNLIKILDGKVFALNPALTYIDFESNLLTNTGTKLLEPLTKLQYAFFSKNICTDIYVSNATEASAAKFKIQLSSNCPPSFDMLVGEILENSVFLDKINSIIAEKVGGGGGS